MGYKNCLQKICDTFFKYRSQPPLSEEQIKSLRLIAHRGAHSLSVKENTMEAFDLCLKNDLWGIEFDVRWTADNVPVIHHDMECDRVFDHPDIIISETSFSDLRKLIPEIPMAREVVDRFAGRLHFMIEIKTQLTLEQEEILFQLLTPLQAGKDYHLMALNSQFLVSLQKFPNSCRLPIAEFNFNELSDKALTHNWAGLTGHYLFLGPQILRKHHDKNQKVGVGYADSKNSLRREVHRGVDWIFTNRALEVQN